MLCVSNFYLDAGIPVFNFLITGNNPQAAISCARKMPQNYKDSYYQPMLELLYKPNIQKWNAYFIF